MPVTFVKKDDESTTRSVTVNFRLDPRTRYLAEIAARKQRRSLSSFIEWAIHEVLGKVTLAAAGNGEEASPTTVQTAGPDLWHVHEADRLVALALKFPELLTYEEDTLWGLIKENGYLWHARTPNRGNQRHEWDIDLDSLKLDVLRDLFPVFKKVADGRTDPSALPMWDAPSGTWKLSSRAAEKPE